MKKFLVLIITSFLLIILPSCNNPLHISSKKIDKNIINSFVDTESELGKYVNVTKLQVSKASIKSSAKVLPAVHFKLYFNLPADIDVSDLTNSIEISLVYKGKTKDILGIDNSGKSNNFTLDNESKEFLTYTVDFVNVGISLSDNAINYMVKNSINDIDVVLLINGEAVITMPLEKYNKLEK